MMLLVIGELYRQQQWVYTQRSERIDNRIVTINKPPVRLVKRDKAGTATEFDAKLSANSVNGYIFANLFKWDNFNESDKLIDQIENYKSLTGCYPGSVYAGFNNFLSYLSPLSSEDCFQHAAGRQSV